MTLRRGTFSEDRRVDETLRTIFALMDDLGLAPAEGITVLMNALLRIHALGTDDAQRALEEATLDLVGLMKKQRESAA